MQQPIVRRSLFVAGLLLVGALGDSLAGSVGVAHAVPGGVDSTALPLRVVDTRTGGQTKLVANAARPIPGLTPTTGSAANAYSMNLTIVGPVADGFAVVHPCDQAAGSTSTVNFRAGETVANAVPIVPVATGGAQAGKVCVTSTVATHAIIDLTAAYYPDRIGAPVAVSPRRLFDSRVGGGARVAALKRTPVSGAPVTGTVGVTLVVTQASGDGWAAVQPCDAPVGSSSTVNFTAGQTAANVAFVPVESGLCVVASVAAHLVVDLVATPSATARLDSAAPRRLLDTRDDVAWLGAGGTAKLSVGLTRTAMLNVTAVDPTGSGFVTVWPCSQPISTTSALSWSGVSTVATAVIANADANGDVCFRPSVGTHLLVDLLGFDNAPPVPVTTSVTGRTNEWVIGTSVQGRAITARAYGSPGGIPVLGVGSIHGDEQWGIGIVTNLKAMTVPAGRTMWLIDSVNPDGNVLDIRQNARGVDLNRNYATNWQPIERANNYSGPAPNSEPETQAVLTFLSRVSPVASVWWHQVGDYVDDSRTSVGRPDLEDVYVATAKIGFDDAPCLGFCGGTATQHLNRVLPRSTHFVVETPSPLSTAGAQRHANAFVAMTAAI
jgi:murein peptide amidase A